MEFNFACSTQVLFMHDTGSHPSFAYFKVNKVTFISACFFKLILLFNGLQICTFTANNICIQKVQICCTVYSENFNKIPRQNLIENDPLLISIFSIWISLGLFIFLFIILVFSELQDKFCVLQS